MAAVEISPHELSGTLVFRASDPVLYHDQLPEGFDEWAPMRVRAWTDEQYRPVVEWLAELGLDHVRALAMFRHGDGRYLLAATQLRRDDARFVVDFASGEPATTYRVLDLGPNAAWPEVFNGSYYRAEAGKWL